MIAVKRNSIVIVANYCLEENL